MRAGVPVGLTCGRLERSPTPAAPGGAIAIPPFPHRRHGGIAPAGRALQGLSGFEARDQFLSTTKRQSGILVVVHPGLLSRVSNDLVATTFPRLAWVNDLLLRHT